MPHQHDQWNADRIAADLRARVEGEVRFDDGSRALYAADASNYRQVPIGVVIPRTVEDVIATVAVCREHGAPLLSRGAGTSLCGQTCNVAVVLDFSKYLNRVLEIDPEARTARVQPGVVLDDLREQARQHGLTFAPDPATHNHNTLGGMIGNNSCGPHSVMGGETEQNVLELDVLTYDGVRMTVGATDEAAFARLSGQGPRQAQIARDLRAIGERYAEQIRARYPRIPRRVSGYNLPQLLPENGFDLARALVGTEGTCVVVLEAKLRLLPQPACRSLVVLGYEDVYEAADHVVEVMQAGPIALEGFDEALVEDMKLTHLHVQYTGLLPDGHAWLLVEFGGATREEADGKAAQLVDTLKRAQRPPRSMDTIEDEQRQAHLWKVRDSALGATAHVPGKAPGRAGWEDSSVPPPRLGEYLRKLKELTGRYGYDCALYGHFGQGCVHTRMGFDLQDAPGIEKYRRFAHEAAHLVTAMGGSISGEHGDGQSKAELLPIMFGDELVRAFGEFKAAWDPDNRMNPGKVVHAYTLDENLRLGTDYAPAPVETRMFFARDNDKFSQAMLRCVGVGECRKKDGTMCPSYQVTMEEKHSTRGRARLLFEMLNGDRERGVLKDGWRSEAVKEALDLCLSCKGCRQECPVKVDMASYKAEFLSHYYEHHARPVSAYAFGFIDRWSRLASAAPWLVNALTQHEPLAAATKAVAGIAPDRALPAFARHTFRDGFRAAPAGTRGGVVLWPDTFNNHFHPQVAHAAAQVLRRGGWDVWIPRRPLCCGRPLYEFGLLDAARDYLRTTVASLRKELRAGLPVVVLEPACLSVFKEELPMMLPRDADAQRLHQQSVLFSEFLHREDARLPLEPLDRPAIVHLHCHHKTVLDKGGEEALLHQLGLQVSQPEDGCCGMAGSFGFESEKYDVSMRCAERALLPAVRQAPGRQLVIANGYSCREQIVQGTGHRVHHLAEVLRAALA